MTVGADRGVGKERPSGLDDSLVAADTVGEQPAVLLVVETIGAETTHHTRRPSERDDDSQNSQQPVPSPHGVRLPEVVGCRALGSRRELSSEARKNTRRALNRVWSQSKAAASG